MWRFINLFLFLSPGLFEVRVQEYLDFIHENEHRRVNRFLKGLGEEDPFIYHHHEASCLQMMCLTHPNPLSFPLLLSLPGNKMKFLSKK